MEKIGHLVFFSGEGANLDFKKEGDEYTKYVTFSKSTKYGARQYEFIINGDVREYNPSVDYKLSW